MRRRPVVRQEVADVRQQSQRIGGVELVCILLAITSDHFRDARSIVGP